MQIWRHVSVASFAIQTNCLQSKDQNPFRTRWPSSEFPENPAGSLWILLQSPSRRTIHFLASQSASLLFTTSHILRFFFFKVQLFTPDPLGRWQEGHPSLDKWSLRGIFTVESAFKTISEPDRSNFCCIVYFRDLILLNSRLACGDSRVFSREGTKYGCCYSGSSSGSSENQYFSCTLQSWNFH